MKLPLKGTLAACKAVNAELSDRAGVLDGIDSATRKELIESVAEGAVHAFCDSLNLHFEEVETKTRYRTLAGSGVEHRYRWVTDWVYPDA